MWNIWNIPDSIHINPSLAVTMGWPSATCSTHPQRPGDTTGQLEQCLGNALEINSCIQAGNPQQCSVSCLLLYEARTITNEPAARKKNSQGESKLTFKVAQFVWGLRGSHFSVRDLKSVSPNQCGNGQLAIGKCLEVHLRISQLRSERGAWPNCAICSVDSRLGLEFDHGSHVLESHLAECDGPSTISWCLLTCWFHGRNLWSSKNWHPKFWYFVTTLFLPSHWEQLLDGPTSLLLHHIFFAGPSPDSPGGLETHKTTIFSLKMNENYDTAQWCWGTTKVIFVTQMANAVLSRNQSPIPHSSGGGPSISSALGKAARASNTMNQLQNKTFKNAMMLHHTWKAGESKRYLCTSTYWKDDVLWCSVISSLRAKGCNFAITSRPFQ